jgi:DNA-binding HxlR family transcriptional regulator
MRSYGQFCPVAKAAEILAERWTPLIVRELLTGSHRFNEIQQGVPRIPRSLLVQRLRSLERAGLVERRDRGYYLSPAGLDLFEVIERMGAWGQRWLNREIRAGDLDPDLLMWDIRRSVMNWIRPGDRRFVAEFHLAGALPRRQRWWLLFEPGTVDLCYKDPGFAVDLFVSTSLRALTQVWLGHISLDQALRQGQLRLNGSRQDMAAFRSWFVLSSFAPAGAAAMESSVDVP